MKEFKDVFAWDYSEMLGLNPGLIAYTLNVDQQAKPMAQPARIFHTEIEGHIVKEVQKLLAAAFIKPIQHPRWLSNIISVKKKNGQIRCCVDFRNLNKAYSKDEFPVPTAKHGFTNRFCSRKRHVFVYGWFQRIQPNQNGTKGCRE